MKVIYIKGPYRAKTLRGVIENIRKAEALAIEVWKLGAVALCPHTMNALFDGIVEDEFYLEGGLELVRRADAVIGVEGWRNSSGSIKESELAHKLKIPEFDTLAGLKTWLDVVDPHANLTQQQMHELFAGDGH